MKEIPEVYLVEREGKKTGVIQRVLCEGYNGQIDILVKISIPEQIISKISILNHHETDDYGGYLTEEWFLKRFIGKKAANKLQLVKIIDRKPEEVVTITGASTTSEGVVSGVNQAFENFHKIYGGINNEKK